MKTTVYHLLAAAILVVAPFQAMAQSTGEESGEEFLMGLYTTFCEGQAQVAQILMSARQGGEPMWEMMKKAREMEAEDPDGLYSGSAERLIEAAFSVPRGETEEERKAIAVEFSSQVYRSCMTAAKEDVNKAFSDTQ